MRGIGKNIRQLRLGKKTTQDDLAERLFVTRQTVLTGAALWLLGIPQRKNETKTPTS